MPDSSRTLIFFTDSFPFGTSETFIENELPFLTQSFERIFIITTNLTDAKTRQIPDHIEIVRIPYKASFQYKVLSLLSYFNPIIQREIGFIKNKFLLPANKQILSLLLASYAKALEINNLLNNIIARHNINLKTLYVYSYWMNDITSGVALFRSKNPEIRAVCRVHRWDVYFEIHNPPYLPLRNFIVENLDMVYCISSDALGCLQKIINGQVSNHLSISRLGTFNSDNVITAPNEGMMRIISCSNLIPTKRVSLIIEALALITGITIKWIHFGNGPLADDLKKLAGEKLSPMRNIQYSFAGQVSNAELLQFYKNNKVDLFINVSESEGIPVSIIEASSFGVAVIGTLVGGVGEILEEGKNGFLLKQSCSPREVADAITKFYMLDEEKKKKIRENAVLIWAQKYSAEKNYKAFLDSVLNLGSTKPVKAD